MLLYFGVRLILLLLALFFVKGSDDEHVHHHQHLCLNENKELSLCSEEDNSIFVCLGAYRGELARCTAFNKEHIAVPVCIQKGTPNVVICETTFMASKQICFPRRASGQDLKYFIAPNYTIGFQKTFDKSEIFHNVRPCHLLDSGHPYQVRRICFDGINLRRCHPSDDLVMPYLVKNDTSSVTSMYDKVLEEAPYVLKSIEDHNRKRVPPSHRNVEQKARMSDRDSSIEQKTPHQEHDDSDNGQLVSQETLLNQSIGILYTEEWLPNQNKDLSLPFSDTGLYKYLHLHVDPKDMHDIKQFGGELGDIVKVPLVVGKISQKLTNEDIARLKKDFLQKSYEEIVKLPDRMFRYFKGEESYKNVNSTSGPPSTEVADENSNEEQVAVKNIRQEASGPPSTEVGDENSNEEQVAVKNIRQETSGPPSTEVVDENSNEEQVAVKNIRRETSGPPSTEVADENSNEEQVAVKKIRQETSGPPSTEVVDENSNEEQVAVKNIRQEASRHRIRREATTPKGGSSGGGGSSAGDSSSPAHRFFLALQCGECTIENELALQGDSKDVENEAESFTLAPDDRQVEEMMGI